MLSDGRLLNLYRGDLMPQTGDSTLTLSPRERRRIRRALQFDLDLPGRSRKGALGGKLGTLLNPHREVYKAKRRRKRKHHKHVYHGDFSRHRAIDLDSPFFINKKRDRLLSGTTVLGKIIQITDGKIVAGLGGNQTIGSDLKPTLHLKETWDQINPGPPYLGGGPFRSIEYNLPASRKVGFGRYSGQRPTGSKSTDFGVYTGSFVDNGFWTGPSYESISSTGFSSFSNLSEYDTRAWDQTKPQIPKASLAQFIYELKDLPGQLETSANAFHKEWLSIAGSSAMVPLMRPKEAAEHFLNHSFGWVPFLSDISKLFDAWNNSVVYLSNLIRDNGIWVRRRRVLEDETIFGAQTQVGVDSATIPSSGMVDARGADMCKPYTIGSNTQKGFCFINTTTERRVWAVGHFKFYRPEFDVDPIFGHAGSAYDDFANLRRLLTFYGLRISPSLLYKITPWTWAADWFTGLGKYLERLDDFVQDGIVSRGLYVMETSKKVMTKTSVLNFYSGPVTLQFQRYLHLKQRKLADSPYGFNVPWNTLTPRQWAILGAIGFTRSGAGYISRGA